MQTLKQEALESLQRLPEDVDIDGIIYQLYVIENVRRGQTDAVQSKTTTADQLLKDIHTW